MDKGKGKATGSASGAQVSKSGDVAADGAEFAVGDHVCAFFRDQYHRAEIVERSLRGGNFTYYVHFEDLDRRMDQWVPADTLKADKDSEEENKQENDTTDGRKMTRNMKRKFDEIHPTQINAGAADLTPQMLAAEKEHEERTKVKYINSIELGRFEIDTWYFSPYPQEYAEVSHLFICEYTLKYFRKLKTLEKHKATNTARTPPGKLIYNHPKDKLAMFEVDGVEHRLYCQNLCLLAKLFLDHKTLYYDVDPFWFYVMCEMDDDGAHIVGYFSKEKESADDYNLACICVLPPYQRKKYGKFLISFSYELSKKAGKIGTPERPLSDLGQLSYRSYWTDVLLEALSSSGSGSKKGNLSIKGIANMTCMKPDDIISTLQSLNLLKYWKGQHIICANPKVIDDVSKERKAKKSMQVKVDPTFLCWTPPTVFHPPGGGGGGNRKR